MPNAYPATPLLRVSRLGARLGLSRLYVKLESANPTGTHKDRAAAEIVSAAQREGSRGVSVGTCGNFGVALARACAPARLPCHVFVPESYGNVRLDEMRSYGGEVTEWPGTYEDAVFRSQEFAEEEGLFDANPNGTGGEHALEAYSAIAPEISAELGETPASVWVPGGNGTTLAGLHRGFDRFGQNPQYGVVSTHGSSALIASLRAGRPVRLDPSKITETEVNEPLVTWDAFHCEQSIVALKVAGGWTHEATDEELQECRESLLQLEGVTASASSCAPLVGITTADGLDPRGAHVLVLTS